MYKLRNELDIFNMEKSYRRVVDIIIGIYGTIEYVESVFRGLYIHDVNPLYQLRRLLKDDVTGVVFTENRAATAAKRVRSDSSKPLLVVYKESTNVTLYLI